MADRIESRTGGRLVVDSLRAHQVNQVFCVPGESYLEILDGLYDAVNEISLVSCRHEGGAAMMAEAYAKMTGRPGVCLVTRGPGASNAMLGVYMAAQDSIPLVLLAGQVPRGYMGREAAQELDFERVFGSVVKWSHQVTSAAEVPEAMARAFHTALSGRQGPVVLALPVDLLREKARVTDRAAVPITAAKPMAADLERMRAMLAQARRPVMIVGGTGWTGQARRDLVAFAEANSLAVCCSFRRHDIFDNNHACFVGELGGAPDPRLIRRIEEADVILAVGARLGSSTTQAYTTLKPPRPRQKLIHVYPDEGELGRVYEPALGIVADVAEFATAARALPPLKDPPWRDLTEAARRDRLDDQKPTPFGRAVEPGLIMRELQKRLKGEAVVTVDAGNFSGWPQRFLSIGAGQHFLGPTSGAMGYGVPAAVMAKIVHPGALVVACVGDGGFGMTGQELATAIMYKAAPIILVFNNGMYGTIRAYQERYHPDRVIGTDLANPDFAQLARAYGGHGEVVERTEDFGPAFDRAVASGTAAVIEIRIDPEIATTRATLTALRGTNART